MSLDGTHIIVKPSGTSHSDLLDSLGAMRALGNSPRYIALMGEWGCLLNDDHIKETLYKTGLDYEHLPGWGAGSRNIPSYVTTLPAWRQPALYHLFLRFKYGTKPGELLWSSFFDPTFGSWNPLQTTVPLVHAMKGLSLMGEFHFGPEFKNWLGETCSLLEDKSLALRFGEKVLYLQSVRALLRFSTIMRMEGAGVNGDPAASPFSDDPANTIENTRALLPALLAHLYKIENIQDAKLNYDQLAIQAGLVTNLQLTAHTTAPGKSAIKRKVSVDFEDHNETGSRSSSPTPLGRPSSPASSAPKPLGQKDSRTKVPPICFRHLRAELGDKNRSGKVCAPCVPRGGGPCPSTHFKLSSWTQTEVIKKVTNVPVDAAGDKDRVLTLLKAASPALFKQS